MENQNQTWNKELQWYGHHDSEDGTQYCEVFPYRSSSYGVWERFYYRSEGMQIWEYPLPNLEIIILFVFILWRFFDIFFQRLRIPIPKFSSMMLAGVVLSEFALSDRKSMIHQIFFPEGNRMKAPGTVGAFGFFFFWFLRGVTIDVGTIRKAGPRACVIGFITMVVPIYTAIVVARFRYRRHDIIVTGAEYAAITLLQSMTAFTGVNTLLGDLKIKHTEFGRIAQSSAMVTDLLAFLLSVAARVKTASLPIWLVLVITGSFLAFLYLARRAMFWVIRRTPQGRPVANVYIYAVLILAYVCYTFWDLLMNFGPFGSFVLGLAVPDGPPFGSTLVQRFESLCFGIMLPLFASLGMVQIDWTWLFGEFQNVIHFRGLAFEAILFILVVTVVKFIGSMLAASYAGKMPWRDSVILAIVLSNKSFFELSYALYMIEGDVVRREVFTITGAYILVNSLLTPMTIHVLYDRTKRFMCYRHRNVMNLKPNAELKALVCINKPDNITSMINFLIATNISEDYPMACNVLHLVERVGKSTPPTFISHQMQKPKPGYRSFSDNVISSFQSFQSIFSGTLSVNTFTSVSAASDMDEDICWLSLDRSIAIMFLSFHQTWAADCVTVVTQDEKMRNLNRSILKRAPCSVGILVSRKPIWQTKSGESCCQVCLIFVGGRDDREALALGERMRQNQGVRMTLMRFIPETGEGDEWNNLLDMEILKEFMGSDENGEGGEGEGDRVRYEERRVEDGTKTSEILKEVAQEHDLFIVGRSSGMGTAVTRGLREWVVFEELGVIGDFLSSDYFPSKPSVLVLQQQQCAAFSS